MKKILERIVASTPVNATAARVVDERGGETWTPTLPPTEAYFETPPPTRPLPPDVPNLIGQRQGRLTVVGLALPRPRTGTSRLPAKWVCRCTCGMYCYRSAKVIKHGNPNGRREQMCERCSALEGVKWKAVNMAPRDFKNVRTEIVLDEE